MFGTQQRADYYARFGITEPYCALPSAPTVGASPRLAKTRRDTSGTRRLAGRDLGCADTPARVHASRSARTADGSRPLARMGLSASGTRHRSTNTKARKP